MMVNINLRNSITTTSVWFSHYLMAANNLDWSKDEIEQIVAWLEEPANLRKTKKCSGKTKWSYIKLIAQTIPTRSEAQVGYKFDNLKKAYREAVKLSDQSCWGLGEEHKIDGVSSLRGKLE
jgi:hypothetical protein